MQNILLPKGYLSYSQWEMWKKSPERYKREYFEKGDKLDTAYLRFGKGIAEMIENGTYKEILPDLPVYRNPEHKVFVEIDGVRLLSFIDSYDPEHNVFLEYKTGKNPWTQSKVQKHEQLPFYAMTLKAQCGILPQYCDLVWIETKETTQKTESFFTSEKNLNCTGKITTFHREFDIREIERLEQDVVKVALEISNAYRAFIAEL